MSNKLDMAVNHALTNSRLNALRAAGFNTGLDSKRGGAWFEYGWAEDVTPAMLLKLYRRGGLAHGAVNKLASSCWRTSPWIVQGDESNNAECYTPWESKSKKVLTQRVWRSFAEADKRRLAAGYAALILHVADSKTWSEPVTQKGRRLDKVTPAWPDALKPIEYETDPNSENYGLVKMWAFTEAAANGAVLRTVNIHPDRVFILGDMTAPGWLEPAFNAFVNIEKVEGGSGESFLKNAARQLNINFDAEIDFSSLADMYGVSIDELQERFNQVAREMNAGSDVVLPTQGATVTPLVTSVPDPSPTYNINLSTIAAALDIPVRILIGNQQGERASTEDWNYFMARCQSRREDLGFEISDFIDHLTRIGILQPVESFVVMWDDLSARNASELLDAAFKMSQINATALSFGSPVFERKEIRAAAGYDNDEEDDTPFGELIDEIDDALGEVTGG